MKTCIIMVAQLLCFGLIGSPVRADLVLVGNSCIADRSTITVVASKSDSGLLSLKFSAGDGLAAIHFTVNYLVGYGTPEAEKGLVRLLEILRDTHRTRFGDQEFTAGGTLPAVPALNREAVEDAFNRATKELDKK